MRPLLTKNAIQQRPLSHFLSILRLFWAVPKVKSQRPNQPSYQPNLLRKANEGYILQSPNCRGKKETERVAQIIMNTHRSAHTHSRHASRIPPPLRPPKKYFVLEPVRYGSQCTSLLSPSFPWSSCSLLAHHMQAPLKHCTRTLSLSHTTRSTYRMSSLLRSSLYLPLSSSDSKKKKLPFSHDQPCTKKKKMLGKKIMTKQDKADCHSRTEEQGQERSIHNKYIVRPGTRYKHFELNLLLISYFVIINQIGIHQFVWLLSI